MSVIEDRHKLHNVSPKGMHFSKPLRTEKVFFRHFFLYGQTQATPSCTAGYPACDGCPITSAETANVATTLPFPIGGP